MYLHYETFFSLNYHRKITTTKASGFGFSLIKTAYINISNEGLCVSEFSLQKNWYPVQILFAKYRYSKLKQYDMKICKQNM
jgi:hypothetical protein